VSDATISYTTNPSVAVLRSPDSFVLLGARAGDVNPHFVEFFDEAMADVRAVEADLKPGEFLKLRKIWHDDKHGYLGIWVDLLHDKDVSPTFTEDEIKSRLHDGMASTETLQSVGVTVNVREVGAGSDAFFPNAPEFYNDL
jgi:hypothetical protein